MQQSPAAGCLLTRPWPEPASSLRRTGWRHSPAFTPSTQQGPDRQEEGQMSPTTPPSVSGRLADMNPLSKNINATTSQHWDLLHPFQVARLGRNPTYYNRNWRVTELVQPFLHLKQPCFWVNSFSTGISGFLHRATRLSSHVWNFNSA